MSAFGGAPDLEQARTSSSATNADRAAVLAARKERRAAAKAAKKDKPRPRRGPTREGRGGEARPHPSAAEYAAAVARGAAAGAWQDVVRTLERMRRDGVAPVAGVYRALDRARRRGEDNDAMRVLFAETPRPLEIVFEDGDVLVVNKPSGVVVQPGRSCAFWSGTLAHAVMAHCCRDDEGPADDWRPSVVHRLDKETSGLVVLAKTELAARSLRAEFAARSVKRVYLALLHGSPLETEGRVETNIAPDPILRRMAALPLDGEGAYAASRYRCIEKLEEYSVVEFRLETGKTHQVRVHALYLGCPLAGDATYGGAGPLDPFLLHAGGLGFVHPRSRELLAFEAGLPPHFERALVKLRRDV